MPNASALGIPLYEFATVKVADEMFSVVFALTNIIGSIFLIIGVVLLVMAILQIVAQFARPFVAGKSLSAWLQVRNLLREGIYVVDEAIHVHLPLLASASDCSFLEPRSKMALTRCALERSRLRKLRTWSHSARFGHCK
jgi:hypothetical protein